MPDNPSLSERLRGLVGRVRAGELNYYAIAAYVMDNAVEILQALDDNERLTKDLQALRVANLRSGKAGINSLFADNVALEATNERLRSCHLRECDMLDFSPDGIEKPCNCIEFQLRMLRSDNEQLEKERAEAVERVRELDKYRDGGPL